MPCGLVYPSSPSWDPLLQTSWRKMISFFYHHRVAVPSNWSRFPIYTSPYPLQLVHPFAGFMDSHLSTFTAFLLWHDYAAAPGTLPGGVLVDRLMRFAAAEFGRSAAFRNSLTIAL